MRHKEKKNGLTLIELLVVVSVLSVLALSLYTVFKMGVDAWSKSIARLEVFQTARSVLEQISMELPGAFVGGGAEFTGTKGDPGVPTADTLEFLTIFSGEIYKIKYQLLNNILQRRYIREPAEYSSTDYEDIIPPPPEDDHIEEAIVEFAKNVSDIQFLYLPLDSAGSWGSTDEKDDWTGAFKTTLPEVVKIILTMENPEDPNGSTYKFETVVYLPNSE